jgi:tRNA (guanine-N7-)-methyltransferase
MAEERVRPARPHHRLTEDGRRMREVLTYSRRGSRLTATQAAAWEAHHHRWVIPEQALDDPHFAWSDWFGREAPMIVEIGSGIGESTAVLAAARPEYDVLALEVWRPGVADGLGRVAEAAITNVRFCSVDAVWAMAHLVEEGSLAALWTFFPDPWPKKRHHKRRLVNPGFAHLAATLLAPGATWRLATDWADYADQMRDALDGEPLLSGGVTDRWEERPVTRFERKGLAAGRAIVDLAYTRRQELTPPGR